MPAHMKSERQNKRQKYIKVPMKTKMLLIKKILQDNQPIKQSAKELKIKYSTAKTFLRQYRRGQLQFGSNEIDQFEKSETNKQFSDFSETAVARCSYKQVDCRQETDTQIWDSLPDMSFKFQKNIIITQNSNFQIFPKFERTPQIQIFSSFCL